MIKQQLENQMKKREDVAQQASFLSNVKQILDSDQQKDLLIVQNAFPLSGQSLVIEEKSKLLRVNRLAEKYNGSVYTLNQIQDLCMKYRLRFLTSQLFKGEVPIEALSKIKEKIQMPELKYLAECSRGEFARNLFVLAPSSMFDLKDGMKRKNEEINLKRIERMRQRDPALFLKVDEGHYMFLHEWGNSFSFARRILGALTARASTWRILFFLIWSTLMVSFATTAVWLYPEGEIVTIPETLQACLSVTVALVGAFIGVTSLLSAENSFTFARWKHSSKGWFAPDPLLPTETNWRESEKL